MEGRDRVGARVRKRVRVCVGMIRQVGKIIRVRIRVWWDGDDAVVAVDDGSAADAEERPVDAAEGDARSRAAGLAFSGGGGGGGGGVRGRWLTGGFGDFRVTCAGH